MIRRPSDSPAVTRARGGANAVEPVASLLRDLHPDGTWAADLAPWKSYSGSVWRLVAAVQSGADPTDPRLQTAAEVLLESVSGEGGFSTRQGGQAVPWMTARLLGALAELGWCRHARFQEALAWLEDGDANHPAGGWRVAGRPSVTGECPVTAVALLGALTACAGQPRQILKGRSVESLVKKLSMAAGARPRLGHPNLGRTDEAEILSALVRAGVPLEPSMVRSLKRVQQRQTKVGRWRRDTPVPMSLPAPIESAFGNPSRWVTLKCVVALMAYAVEARLPRMYPQKPPTHPVASNQ